METAAVLHYITRHAATACPMLCACHSGADPTAQAKHLVLALVPRVEALEHWSILEHVWQNEKANLTPAQVHLFELLLLPVALGQRDVLHATVHVILAIAHETAVHLPILELHRDNVTLRLV